MQVYANNVENLETADENCPGDWTDLIYYMRLQEYVPDLFFVQQVSDQAQLKVITDRMSNELAGSYAGVIADRSPSNPGGSDCNPGGGTVGEKGLPDPTPSSTGRAASPSPRPAPGSRSTSPAAPASPPPRTAP